MARLRRSLLPLLICCAAAAQAESRADTALDLHYAPEERALAEHPRGGALEHLRTPSAGGDTTGTPGNGPTPALELGWVIPSACEPGIMDGPMSRLHEGRAFDCEQRGYALSLGIRNR